MVPPFGAEVLPTDQARKSPQVLPVYVCHPKNCKNRPPVGGFWADLRRRFTQCGGAGNPDSDRGLRRCIAKMSTQAPPVSKT
jgi:hypothetical protein